MTRIVIPAGPFHSPPTLFPRPQPIGRDKKDPMNPLRGHQRGIDVRGPRHERL